MESKPPVPAFRQRAAAFHVPIVQAIVFALFADL
jgi:hypothetical protein